MNTVFQTLTSFNSNLYTLHTSLGSSPTLSATTQHDDCPYGKGMAEKPLLQVAAANQGDLLTEECHQTPQSLSGYVRVQIPLRSLHLCHLCFTVRLQTTLLLPWVPTTQSGQKDYPEVSYSSSNMIFNLY